MILHLDISKPEPDDTKAIPKKVTQVVMYVTEEDVPTCTFRNPGLFLNRTEKGEAHGL